MEEGIQPLGPSTAARRRPYFDIATDSGRGRPERLYAFLDIERPTTQELVAIRDYVLGGGRILTAGVTGIEVCFGYRSRRLARDVDNDTPAPPVRGAGGRLPPTRPGGRRVP